MSRHGSSARPARSSWSWRPVWSSSDSRPAPASQGHNASKRPTTLHSCRSCVRGWSGRRPTGRSCRRSCAGSGRRERSWSAPSSSSNSRWPSLARWEAAPLLLLPPSPTPTPHPVLPPSQRPQRPAKSNCHPSRRFPLPASFLSPLPANSADTNKSA